MEPHYSQKENLPHSLSYKEIQITPKKISSFLKNHKHADESTLQKTLPSSSTNQIHTIKSFRTNQNRKIKKPWTKQEDQLLRNLVHAKGAKQWAVISSFFSDRCGKQCRQRWHNHLRDGIRKEEWTSDEEWILYLGVKAHGKKWSTISKMLEGRTQNTLKNHWNCKMKPKRENLQHKLAYLLEYHPNSGTSLQSFEVKLLELIRLNVSKNEVNGKYDGVQQILNILSNSLKIFYKTKRQILKQHNTEHIEVNHRSLFQLNSFKSFGKSKNQEKCTLRELHKKSRFPKDISKNDDEVFQDSQYASQPFEVDQEQCEKLAEEEMESIEGQSSDQENIFYENSDIQNEGLNSSVLRSSQGQKFQDDEKSEIIDFSSPIRMNIFDGIDLGESNKKKKLFK